jgi:hypothetical protein
VTKKYYLHLGAHRTGSSSFQLCLHRNRETLLKSGYNVAFPSRDGVNSGELALRLPAPRHRDDEIPRFVDRVEKHLKEPKVTGARGPVILSEENMLGGMVHFEKGQFYPAAEKRLQAMRSAMGEPPEHVVLVIREYASFFRSCFRKRAETKEVKPFRDLVPHYLSMDRGWYEIVHTLLENLHPTALTVVDYRARGLSTALLKELAADLRTAALKEPHRTLNNNVTDAGLLTLQELYKSGRSLSRKEVWKVKKAHADQTESLGFSEYTEAELNALRLRYEQDLERISKIPGLTLKVESAAANVGPATSGIKAASL